MNHSRLRATLLLMVLWLLVTSLTSAETKSWVIVHCKVKAQVSSSSGEVLGQTGKALDLRLPDDLKGHMTFHVNAEGHKEKIIEIPLNVLASTNRLPTEGEYELEPDSRSMVLPLVLGGLLSFFGLVLVLQRAKKSTPPIAGDDPFVLGDLLGEGSTSLVYGGTSSLAKGSPLAIKLLREELLEESNVTARFQRESEISMGLKHPNLVKVHHCGVSKAGQPYLLLERLQGQTLADFLLNNPKPGPERVADILGPLCEVLSYLHDQDIVHRDIKPANIFLTEEAQVKLLDLGLARGEQSADITQTGRAVGTPNYMPPEQLLGEFSHLTDQYSVGVVMFELLTGQKPFDDQDVLDQHLHASVPLLQSIESSVTELQDSVVHRLMEKRPEARFANMREAREAIMACLDEAADDGTMLCG